MRFMNRILRSLTEAQRQAVTHVEGPLLVLAGPGSGKTRVVTHRIAYLLEQGIPPWQIVALTFTNKAAEEMSRRVAQLAPGRRVWISTFHSFAARLLWEFAPLVGLQPNYSIYDADASLQVAKRALEQAEKTSRLLSAEKLQQRISFAKARLMSPEEFLHQATDPLSRAAAEIYPVYQRLLLEANAVDFDDLLMHVATLLRDQPDLRAILDDRYRFVLVDEYQDTNLAQYAIVRALCIDHPHLAVTGDPDQSIYGWRGADIANILRFEEDYPTMRLVRLEENFRSTRHIVNVAGHLIAHNHRRKAKAIFTRNPAGSPVRLVRYASSDEEAQHIADQIQMALARGRSPGDFAVFYRTNALSRSVEQALRRAGIPYQVVRGLEFYQRREIKDLLAYLYLLNNPRDDEAFRRIINVPPRGIGRQTLARLLDFATERSLPLLAASKQPAFLRGLSKRAAEAFLEFHRQFDEWSKCVGQPVHELLETIIDDLAYYEYLEGLSSEADVDRQANVQELLADARSFQHSESHETHLEAFLERVALVSDTDAWDQRSAKVSLMTLHAAKGLEFPVVYIIGVEEGLLPHERSRQDETAVEEERRLLFVGITRAREELQLSFADYRTAYGNYSCRIPSPFLHELPLQEMERVGWKSDRSASSFAVEMDFEPEATGVDDEPAWQVDEAAPEVGKKRRRRTGPVGGARSATSSATTSAVRRSAKAEAAQQIANKASATSWHVGDRVVHPTHGPGVIIRASGAGKRRVVSVQFDQDPEYPIAFCVEFSPLEHLLEEPLPPHDARR